MAELGEPGSRCGWRRPCFDLRRRFRCRRPTPRAALTHARIDPMAHSSSSRRQFLRRAGAGLLAVPLGRARRAQATLRDGTLRLDWVFQGPNAGFMVAQDKGFYAEAGLNVDIGPGKGSGSTAQLVASKATQFGYSDGFVVGNSVSKGMSIRTVAGIYRRNPTAVIVLADSDIRTPKDLEGKSIALTPGSAQFQQWPAFAKGCGVDASKVRVVSIDPAGTPPALIAGQVPAIAGFAQGQVPTVEIRGNKKTRVFWYADCGVAVVHRRLLRREPRIKEDPALGPL